MREEHFAKIINDNNYKIAVEIGVRNGYFSDSLLKNTKLDVIYAIDPWTFNEENHAPDTSYYTAKELLGRHKERCQMIRATGNEASFQFYDDYFDFVYLDALHDFDSVYNDCMIWWPKVKSGGILAGHDYVIKEGFGVIEAVDRFVKEKNLELNTIGKQKNWRRDINTVANWWITK